MQDYMKNYELKFGQDSKLSEEWYKNINIEYKTF